MHIARKVRNRLGKCCQEIIFDYLLLSARCFLRRESKRKHWTSRYERHGVALARGGAIEQQNDASRAFGMSSIEEHFG